MSGKRACAGAKGAAGAVSGANRIPITHARQVLGFSEGQAVKDLDKAMVMDAYAKLFALNDPADGGSLYIQAKVYHAKEALLEALGVPHEERELPDDMEGQEESGEPAKQGEIGNGGDEKADREERR